MNTTTRKTRPRIKAKSRRVMKTMTRRRKRRRKGKPRVPTRKGRRKEERSPFLVLLLKLLLIF